MKNYISLEEDKKRIIFMYIHKCIKVSYAGKTFLMLEGVILSPVRGFITCIEDSDGQTIGPLILLWLLLSFLLEC